MPSIRYTVPTVVALLLEVALGIAVVFAATVIASLAPPVDMAMAGCG